MKYVRAVRKSKVRTVCQPWLDHPKPGNMEHQSSDHDELTHADCPPYTAGRSVTWELVLSGLRPRTVHSTNTQKHTVPAQIQFGSCGRSADLDQIVRTRTHGQVQLWTLSGQGCGRSGPKAQTVRSTNEQDLSEVNRLRTPLEDRGRSAHMARTVRLSQDLATFQTRF